jgi:hypothetical protein
MAVRGSNSKTGEIEILFLEKCGLGNFSSGAAASRTRHKPNSRAAQSTRSCSSLLEFGLW